jgi:hypothetical protein
MSRSDEPHGLSIVLATMICTVALGLTIHAAGQTVGTDAALAAAEGWKAHRDSFDRWQCRYQATWGELHSPVAATVEAHAAQQVLSLSSIEEYRSVKEGSWNWTRKNCLLAPKSSRSMSGPGGGGGFVSCTPREFLWSDLAGLDRSRPDDDRARLLSTDQFPDGWGPAETPFSMGMMGSNECRSPYVAIHEALRLGRCTFEGEQDWGGRRCLVVRISLANERELFRYFLDVERGFLAARIDYCVKGPGEHEHCRTRGVLTDAIACSDGRFFPRRSVRVSEPDAPPGQVRSVLVVETLELETDGRPPRESFQLLLPAGCRIQLAEGPSVRLVEGGEVFPDMLLDLRDHAVASQPQMVMGTLPPPRSRAKFWVIAAVVALLGVCIVGVPLLRRSKRRSRAV